MAQDLKAFSSATTAIEPIPHQGSPAISDFPQVSGSPLRRTP